MSNISISNCVKGRHCFIIIDNTVSIDCVIIYPINQKPAYSKTFSLCMIPNVRVCSFVDDKLYILSIPYL